MQEPDSTLHQIMQRLAALEAQVAALSQAAGLAGPGPAVPGGQPEPVMGRPVPSSGYGSLGPAAGPAFPDVVQLARSGNKIAAIKLYRDYTGLGLQEAKYFVDNC